MEASELQLASPLITLTLLPQVPVPQRPPQPEATAVIGYVCLLPMETNGRMLPRAPATYTSVCGLLNMPHCHTCRSITSHSETD